MYNDGTSAVINFYHISFLKQEQSTKPLLSELSKLLRLYFLG